MSSLEGEALLALAFRDCGAAAPAASSGVLVVAAPGAWRSECRELDLTSRALHLGRVGPIVTADEPESRLPRWPVSDEHGEDVSVIVSEGVALVTITDGTAAVDD